ncbi:MBL fold metallo-hydrolase [Candidatus Nanohalococcus occultus]|uniref:mRNA degradation ribonuclease J1/J2 n=1 Tax=Candidatus Nanohalococcus occultus TaxID=2978047 RepID=A0ABY8CH12_9ARCH|nr:mRNA degradation ribonuclease J1/J2 [Candidatus Nanohaloarchaeota archaeon SVXNc]
MKVYTLGGYEEVGRNMTAVEVEGEVVIFDMGYDMEEVVNSEGQIDEMTTNQTLETGAIPEDEQLLDKNVVAIVIGHGHLDHVGAIPKLAGAYDNAPIYATPYTMKIIERMIDDDRKNISNEMVTVQKGDETDLTDNLRLEFAHVNHSIPDATLSLLDTPEGYVVYGNDMKIDQSPIIEETTDVERLKEIGEEGVTLMVPGTTRVDSDGRARSEKSVEVELKDVLDSCYQAGGAVIASTFSSQISRLNSLIDANNGRRKIAFVGRSLKEYVKSAEELGLIDTSNIEVVSYFNECDDVMSKVDDNKEDWLVVATGNQGEPGAQMDKISSGTYGFNFEKGDHVIFSSKVIPTPVNEANRHTLEKKMKERGVRIYKGIHTTGHAHREDHRDFIKFLDPENIVPSHGHIQKLGSYVELAREEGYTLEEDIFVSENGREIQIN